MRTTGRRVNNLLLLSRQLYMKHAVFAKTAGLSDKTDNFLFCPAKIFGLSDSCPANFQLPSFSNRHFFHFLKISFTFLGKKALNQYHLSTKIIFSNAKLLSVETKICLSCRFPLCPGENFCLTDSCPVTLQKFS